MTRRELIEKRGWKTKDIAETFIGRYWNIDTWWDNLDCPVCRYDILCNVPFYVVNGLYNDAYNKDSSIGSLYDWLERCDIEDDDPVMGYGYT